MQPFQAQLSRTASDHISASVPLARLAKLVARLVDRLAGAKAGVATPCEGHAWCDSMERQLVDDVASYRRTRF